MAAHIYVRPQGRVMDRGTVFSLTIGGFPVLDSAIGNGIWMLLLAFAKLYTPHKQKSCNQHSAMTETTVKQRAFAFIMLDLKKWDSGFVNDGTFLAQLTPRAGIPPVIAWRRTRHRIKTVSSAHFISRNRSVAAAYGRKPGYVASKKCQLGDCVNRFAHARLLPCVSSLQPEYSRCNRCLAVKSIWDRSLYLVVKISSDIMTQHCSQICVLFMMFCRSDCWLCAGMWGKWLRNQPGNSSKYHVVWCTLTS